VATSPLRHATHPCHQENFRQIHERVSDRLLDTNPEYEQMPLNFHLTSVYDHSLHEAFSRVLHKLIDSMPFLEALLNVFCAVGVQERDGNPLSLIPQTELAITKGFSL
jgi:hypothetical protein